jgi:putative colanic acid biosynthesis acetyltransferase WcaF
MTDQDYPISNHYVVSVFSRGNKVKRLLWQMVWTVCCRWTPAPFYFWRNFIIRLFGGIIGNHVHIYPTCKIWAPWLLVMEDFSCIGPGVAVYNPGGCTIGRYAIVSQDAYLCGATHDFNNENFTYIKKEIVIEEYAWICAKATVLPGVRCGEGAVLGAAAVASKNLEPWSVYAGNPAKFIKTRNNFKNK